MAVVLAFTLSCSSPPRPAEYTLGSRLERVTLADQFDQEWTLDAGVDVVLFARDMAGGGLIKEVLAEHPEALAANRGVYVADISGMPGLIARMSAIPKMRERPYPTLLDRDGTATRAFPAKDGQATILRLSALVVSEVRFVDSTEDLRAALGLAGGS